MTKPLAIILGGYYKLSQKKINKENKKFEKSNDGDNLFYGKNKFLFNLHGKPVIEYVIQAVHGSKLFDKIFVVNDKKEFNEKIDTSKYPNLKVIQQENSIEANIKLLYDSVPSDREVFGISGDLPRATMELVTNLFYIHKQKMNEVDYWGNKIKLSFGMMDYNIAKDENWLQDRFYLLDKGRHKGELKYPIYLKMKGQQKLLRFGNSFYFQKDKTLDSLLGTNFINFLYSVRRGYKEYPKIMMNILLSGNLLILWKVYDRKLEEIEAMKLLKYVAYKRTGVDTRKLGISFTITPYWAAENDIDGERDWETYMNRKQDLNNIYK